MTTTATASLRPGDSFTWTTSAISYLSTLTVHGGEQLSRRGQIVTVTDELIRANADRNGDSFITVIHDADEQVRRFGKVIAVPGAVEMSPWEPDSVEHDDARDSARRVALAEADPAKRATKLREVEAIFGKVANPSNQVSSSSPDDATRDRLLRAEGRR